MQSKLVGKIMPPKMDKMMLEHMKDGKKKKVIKKKGGKG